MKRNARGKGAEQGRKVLCKEPETAGGTCVPGAQVILKNAVRS